MIRAPITVKIMLACHVSPDPEREVGIGVWNSEVGRGCRFWLQENDLIDDSNRSTAKGKAWVEFIVNTPVPVATWVLPPRDNGHVEMVRLMGMEPEHDPPHPNLVKLMRNPSPWETT